MFDTSFNYLLSPTTFRYSSKLTQSVQSLTRIKDSITSRYFINRGSQSKGSVLLQHLLENAFVFEKVLLEKDLFARYLNVIQPMVPTISRIIDPVANHIIRTTDYFIKDNGVSNKEEYFIPVTVKNSELRIPYTLDWNVWKNIRPFRLMNVTNPVLTYNIQTDMLIYKRPPRVSVFTVDIGLLVMQYSVYLDNFQLTPNTVDIVDYLHKYVIFPCLSQDPLNIWLLQNYISVMDTIRLVQNGDVDFQYAVANQGRLGSQFIVFYEELEKYVTDLKNGNTKGSTLFKGLPLQNTDAQDYFIYLKNNVELPNLSQYNSCEYMVYETWFNLLFKLTSLSPLVKNNSIKTNIVKDSELLLLKRFYTQPGFSPLTKTHIEKSFMNNYNSIKYSV